MNDVVLSKKASIERCILQVRTYYEAPSDKPLQEDQMRIDAIA